ncbi:DNA/RNA polymerase, partial [Phytophthora palmivora]
MVHLAPVCDKVTGKQAAQLFLDIVFRYHGLPETIVSDRDPGFTGAFWDTLSQLLGIKLTMSTADHPQTDGQTERVNRVLEDTLRSIWADAPRSWSDQLPMVEFALNNAVHASTGFTPFYLNGLRHPQVPLTLRGGTVASISARMSAGVIIGIIAGVLVVLGVAGFFVYRYMGAQRQDDEKQFMQDYPVSKVTTTEPNPMPDTQNTPTEYDFTTLDAPSTKATPDPLASSIAMLHAVPGGSPSPSQEPTRYNFDPAQSTVNGAAPSTSPFAKKDSVQASRPSNTNFEAHSMEFNAAPGSYAESYNESYAGSFAGSMAGSYANSFSGTYNGQGVLNSFDGSV